VESYFYDYTATRTEEGMKLEASLYAGNEEIETVVEEDLPGELLEIARTCEVNQWNGFHKTGSYVLDGESFALSMKFEDDSVLSASGNNSFPEGYREAQRQVVAFFEDAVERYAPPGDVPTSVRAVFEREESRFELYAPKESGGMVWLRLDISDPDGQYGMGEEYFFKEYVKEFPFETIGQIALDYDVAAWNGWDQEDESEEGREQFELSLDFGMGKSIWAKGTQYSENYEQVRECLIRERIDFAHKNGWESQPKEQ